MSEFAAFADKCMETKIETCARMSEMGTVLFLLQYIKHKWHKFSWHKPEWMYEFDQTDVDPIFLDMRQDV